jgi:hypothetical protein
MYQWLISFGVVSLIVFLCAVIPYITGMVYMFLIGDDDYGDFGEMVAYGVIIDIVIIAVIFMIFLAVFITKAIIFGTPV